MRTRILVATAFGLALIGGSALAKKDDPCFYRGTMYSDGAASCQNGIQYRCDDGTWDKRGGACQPEERVAVSKPCDFGGISYSTGSASCQEGMQYRCEDGTWRRLGATCAVGDAPIRALPSGRTCMFDGATVATNSAICRSGSTFLCSDGEWVNVGTPCR